MHKQTHVHTRIHTAPAPPLLGLLQRTDGTAPLPREPGKSRALVGGCGSGYDCWTLARHGWRVTGLDLSPTAVARAKELLLSERERQEEKGEAAEWTGSVELVCGDYFGLPEKDGFDLIFDYTVRGCVPAAAGLYVDRISVLTTPQHPQPNSSCVPSRLPFGRSGRARPRGC